MREVRGQNYRRTDIVAKADRVIWAKLSYNLPAGEIRLSQLHNSLNLRQGGTVQPFGLNRFKRITCLGNLRRLHPFRCANKQDFRLRIFFLHGVGQRQRRIDMTAGTAGRN